MKVYQLLVNESEVTKMSATHFRESCAEFVHKMHPPPPSQPCRFLLDTVFAKGMTVRQSKEELLPQLQDLCNLDLSIDR